jgi:hypothetical protein
VIIGRQVLPPPRQGRTVLVPALGSLVNCWMSLNSPADASASSTGKSPQSVTFPLDRARAVHGSPQARSTRRGSHLTSALGRGGEPQCHSHVDRVPSPPRFFRSGCGASAALRASTKGRGLADFPASAASIRALCPSPPTSLTSAPARSSNSRIGARPFTDAQSSGFTQLPVPDGSAPCAKRRRTIPSCLSTRLCKERKYPCSLGH